MVWATSSNISKVNLKSGATLLPTCRWMFKKKSLAACKTHLPAAGKNLIVDTSSNYPPARLKTGRNPTAINSSPRHRGQGVEILIFIGQWARSEEHTSELQSR